MARQGENPVDRVKTVGVKSASIIDLLAVAYSRNEKDAKAGEEMARAILNKYTNIAQLGEIGAEEIRDLSGLEGFEVLRVLALIELGRRVASAGKGPIKEINSPQDVFSLLEPLRHEKREHFVAILVSAKNEVLKVAYIHIGTLNMSLVGPREVFREAIREGANSVIVAHNHPSGDPTPSPEDIDVTKKLIEVGAMLDIPVLDHVIIGYRNFVSMKEKRLI